MRATALIQADLMVCQAAAAAPVVSTAMETTVTGGLLQSLVPTHGNVGWTATTALSTETTTVEAAAFLLVASGIKNFKL